MKQPVILHMGVEGGKTACANIYREHKNIWIAPIYTAMPFLYLASACGLSMCVACVRHVMLVRRAFIRQFMVPCHRSSSPPLMITLQTHLHSQGHCGPLWKQQPLHKPKQQRIRR